MKTQLRQHHAQQAFERNAGRLRLELRMGTPRRHLDVLVELLEELLQDCGQGTLLTVSYRAELRDLKQDVATRGNLRLVRGGK